MSVPLWDPEASYERVAIEGAVLEIPVGLLDWEKAPGRTQRVEVAVELFRHRGPLEDDGLAACLDYDRIARHLFANWTPARPHTDLLETLAEELIALALEEPRVEACRVTLRKPEVYDGRAVPVLEVYRRRDG